MHSIKYTIDVKHVCTACAKELRHKGVKFVGDGEPKGVERASTPKDDPPQADASRQTDLVMCAICARDEVKTPAAWRKAERGKPGGSWRRQLP